MVDRLTIAPLSVSLLLKLHACIAPKTQRARRCPDSSTLCSSSASVPSREHLLRSCTCPIRTRGIYPAGFYSSFGLRTLRVIVSTIDARPSLFLRGFSQLTDGNGNNKQIAKNPAITANKIPKPISLDIDYTIHLNRLHHCGVGLLFGVERPKDCKIWFQGPVKFSVRPRH